MRIVVTGAAGFIGSNILVGLNAIGIDDIIAVDDLTDGSKFRNLRDARFADYVDSRRFYDLIEQDAFGKVSAIFHEGACSDTMEQDGRRMMELNYDASLRLLNVAERTGTRLLYASSAAVYGASRSFGEDPRNERPLNVYAYSKLLFDQVLRRRALSLSTQVAGFRYFNVYGPRENHKGRMASVAFQHYHQFRNDGRVRLFGANDGYGDGEQRRDFVYVDDIVATKLWFLEHPEVSGIYNLGTGRAQQFNELAEATINVARAQRQLPALPIAAQVEQGLIEYIPFPDALMGKYQSFTEADIGKLRAAGYDRPFLTVAEGVEQYVAWLERDATE